MVIFYFTLLTNQLQGENNAGLSQLAQSLPSSEPGLAIPLNVTTRGRVADPEKGYQDSSL